MNVQRKITGIMFEMGYLEPAKVLLEKELDQEDTAEARMLLAAVCKGLGKTGEMRKHLEKLLTMRIPDEARKQIMDELKKL